MLRRKPVTEQGGLPRRDTAQQLCHEQWLKDDLAEAKSHGAPLWDGKAKLRARIALPDESACLPRPKITVKRLTS